MLVKLIRYVRGYVTCIARGKFTERLINILNRQGYTYWNIVPCKDGISFSVNVREYKRLRKSLYKTGIKTRRTLPGNLTRALAFFFSTHIVF